MITSAHLCSTWGLGTSPNQTCKCGERFTPYIMIIFSSCGSDVAGLGGRYLEIIGIGVGVSYPMGMDGIGVVKTSLTVPGEIGEEGLPFMSTGGIQNVCRSTSQPTIVQTAGSPHSMVQTFDVCGYIVLERLHSDSGLCSS